MRRFSFDALRIACNSRPFVRIYLLANKGGAWPEELVAERYSAQRTIYALAALTLGATAVEVVHLFLEEPDAPVSARFAATDLPALEAELTQRVAGPLTGDFPVSATPGRRVCDGCPAQGGLCSYPVALTAR